VNDPEGRMFRLSLICIAAMLLAASALDRLIAAH
jgi:hypothetical protein